MEIELTLEAKLDAGDARVTRIAKKTKHIFEERRQ